MTIQLPEMVTTPSLPAPRGCYSQGIRAGRFLFTCGLGPRDARTGELAPPVIAAQTDQVMSNLQALLSTVGASLRDVVHVKAYLAQIDRDFPDFDTAYARWWDEYKPARTTVGAGLYGILVELEAVVLMPSGAPGTRPANPSSSQQEEV
jgi:2-iminobutanoate/2-iminopropanoate deaminase